MGNKWKLLSKKEKEPFNVKANADKLRYFEVI